MTKAEFCETITYIANGCGKELKPAALEVYYDCFVGIEWSKFKEAARVVLRSHKFPTFPTIAEIHDAVKSLTPVLTIQQLIAKYPENKKAT